MGKIKWYQSIQFKLQLYICVVFMLCVGSILFHDYISRHDDLELSLQEEMQNRYSQVIEHIDNATLRAVSLSSWVANSENIQKLFASRDRAHLQEVTLPIYDAAKKTANFDKFQFHLPPAISFLRLHKLGKFGDDLSQIRPTIIAVNSSKKNVQGLDRGKFGFGMRGLSPVFYNNKHIGSVEFGVGLNDNFLKKLKDIYNTNVAIVVNSDDGYKVLAKSYSFSDPEILYEAYRSVLSGGTEKTLLREFEGGHIYSFIGPLKDFSGKVEGVVVVEKDVTDQVNNLKSMLVYYTLAAIFSSIIIILVVYFIIKRLLQEQIRKFSSVFRSAAKGDLTVRSNVLNNDEMGMLGHLLNNFTESLQVSIKSISTDAIELDNSSTNMYSVAKELSEETNLSEERVASVAENADKTSEDMNAVATAMEELSTNTKQIAKSTSSMSETVKEISRNTDQASQISGNAVSKVESASLRVDELGDAAQKIGQVSDTITDISEQTNLLALNATIEAARAGELGKGFAVVADEIKGLAHQTAEATDKIKESIGWIQDSTKATVDDIKEVATIISEVNKLVKNISHAVDQQAITIEEIDNNVSEGANAIQEVSVNVVNTSNASDKTSHDVNAVSKSISQISSNSSNIASGAQQLSGLAKKLHAMVNQFKVS